ncbi:MULTISPECIES: DUF6157 family protein [unclassified Beijerinckia]|uniref:DUF6157 family protein n=1 Tax=unclassified Beijerinckia TaxID=2638183 RepID=UPI0008973F66|nr:MULTISPECIES: DUF6157 family protein [unclassified Beijerinckia]MDH7796284.1 hypothetical protein [Beijerinckia sp. GAS462]SEC38387.1 hypothetical protein SAMN05443249_2567 [Beijerinckia sp. 28-YEA-48]
MKSTNYLSTFIVISPDSAATQGTVPEKAGSIAAIQHRLLKDKPYGLTSDDVLFLTHAERAQIPKSDWKAARAEFFAKPKACLRCSPLVKQFGWGLHHDEKGRVALYGVETQPYRQLAKKADLKIVNGMRSSRA